MKFLLRILPVLAAAAWVWFYSVPALAPLRDVWSESFWLLVLLVVTALLGAALALTSRGIRWSAPFGFAALFCGGYLMMTVPSAAGERFVHLLSLESDLFGRSAQGIWAAVQETWAASHAELLDVVPANKGAWWKPLVFMTFMVGMVAVFQKTRLTAILLFSLVSTALILGLGEAAHLKLVPAVGTPFLIFSLGALIPSWSVGFGWLPRWGSRKEKKVRSGRPAAVRVLGVKSRVALVVGNHE